MGGPRTARLRQLRRLVPDPRPGDVAGPLAGPPGEDGKTRLHELSSVEITDILLHAGEWTATVGGVTHRFLDQDPRSGRRFALGSSPAMGQAPRGPAARLARRGR